jgi:hypothetical protein
MPGRLRLAAALLLVCGIQLPAAPGSRSDPAAPAGPFRYTLFAEISPPVAANRAKLQALLKAEGYPSYREGESEIALVLTEAEMARLFQARIAYRSVERSASAAGAVRQPYLENAAVPARYRGLIRRLYLDPQRG